jgi:hypothetical protein
MFNTVKNVLSQGGYDLKDILNKIEVLWVKGKLTDEEHEELITLARDGAKPENSLDVFAKLDEFEKRIRALKDNTDKPDAETYIEFENGKWYYNGDKILFEGENYVCIAPEGTVCVWSPKDYPTYWEKAV